MTGGGAGAAFARTADTGWIDSHCHFDVDAFDADRDAAAQRARAAGVEAIVIPAVTPDTFGDVIGTAHRLHLAYGLGSHPMYLDDAGDDPVAALEAALDAHAGDARLVAVGEIGIDHYVEGLDRARQQRVFVGQLKLARRHGLPVLMHGRKAWDHVIAGLRRVEGVRGIAHAFNGSHAQAERLLALGCKLGFGGAVTFDRALHLRRLAAELPDEAFVMETDAPDIPPQWAYRTAEARAAGAPMRNEPAHLPAIGAALAALRGRTAEDWARICGANTRAVLPRLAAVVTPPRAPPHAHPA